MKQILINGKYKNDIRVAILESNNLSNLIFDKKKTNTSIQGNIYLAKVKNINKALQAVFIEYENGKTGFLPFNHIHPAYYNANSIAEALSRLSLMKIEDVNENDNEEDLEIEKSFPSKKNNLNSLDTGTNNDLLVTNHSNLSSNNLSTNESNSSENTNVIIDKTAQDESLKLSANSDSVTNPGLTPGAQDVETPIDVEATIDNENDDEKLSPKPLENVRKYEIQDVIKRDQFILVQGYKEPKGEKAYMFSTYISLIGRYIILLPNQKDQIGVSKKINPASERARIKNIVQNIIGDKLDTCGLIARTGSLNKTTNAIKKDYNYCAKLWNKIINTVLANKAEEPIFLYQEEGLINRIVRDFLDHRVEKIIIDSKELYNEAIDFISNVAPDSINKVKKYSDTIPLFSYFNIENQIIDLYKPLVKLKSGGYLIINPTEALTAIDINSGKSNTESNLNDTAFKINEEAANEIVKQIHLRNISGLIVIDFIDMESSTHKKHIEQLIKKCLSNDKSRTQVGEINQFGLLEISRQRTSASFIEIHSNKCSICDGKGLVRNPESDSLLILRTLENEIAEFYNKSISDIIQTNNDCQMDCESKNKTSQKNQKEVSDDELRDNSILDHNGLYQYKIIANPERLLGFLNYNKKFLVELEDIYKVEIILEPSTGMSNETFSIDRIFVEKPMFKQAIIQQGHLVKQFKFSDDSFNELENGYNQKITDKSSKNENRLNIKDSKEAKALDKFFGFLKKFW